MRACGRCSKPTPFNVGVEDLVKGWNRDNRDLPENIRERPLSYSDVVRCIDCYRTERAEVERIAQSDFWHARSVAKELMRDEEPDGDRLRRALTGHYRELVVNVLKHKGKLSRDPGEEG